MVITWSLKLVLPESESKCPIAHFPMNGTNMTLLWQKHGPKMVLQIWSSWFLINEPSVALYQISHCWIYPVTPFPRNGQNLDLYGPKMVLKWSLILVLADFQSICPGILYVKFEICGSKPHFLEMAKICLSRTKHVPHMALNICSSRILIKRCSMPNFTLLGVSCSPLS